MNYPTVTVIGAGTMGTGIALSFGLGGHTVTLVDVSAEALSRAERRLELDSAALNRTPPSIRLTSDLGGSLPQAGLVLESAPEDMNLKRAVWRDISTLAAPDAVLATNTSSFDLSEFAAAVVDPSRVIGLHWFNPAHLVPCVEVVRGSVTSDEVVQRCVEMLTALGKRPAMVKSTPGFVANRIQMAMAAEALRCLDEGVASAEAIDDIVQHSLGFRLAEIGPLRLADLAGLDVYAAIYGYLNTQLGERFQTPRLVADCLSRQSLGVKTGEGIYSYRDDEGENLIQRRNEAFAARAATTRAVVTE